MRYPNTFGIIAILSLVLAASMNLMLYDISLNYSILFVLIPLALGTYGIISRSRAFILSGAASLLLVSLRPDTGNSPYMVPFLLGFLLFVEMAEASIRLDNDPDGTSRSNYLVKGGVIMGATIAFALIVYYLTPAVTSMMGKAASSAAILDTIQLPLVVGLILLSSMVIASFAIKD